jgi:anti-sigma regulatory factor (Ser/Thr protein kinase)
MESSEAEIKFFIHDLRVDKFFLHLIKVHENLVAVYDDHDLAELRARHRDYIERLRIKRHEGHEARVAYEVTVKSRRPSKEIIEGGRRYINATLKTCRVALLPHWRDFRPFVEQLAPDATCRKLESSFNECKNWIGSIDRRIVNFKTSIDKSVPFEAISPRQVIREYVDSNLRYYVRNAGKKRLEVKVGRSQVGFIYADRSRFRRLIFNLVMNAVDAMKCNRVGVVLLEVFATDLLVTIEVTDEGVGMKQEKVEQILNNEKDLTGELHSLGFVFVRQTVEEFNGKLYVESIPRKGTKIRLVFPRYKHDGDELANQPSSLLEEDEEPALETVPAPSASQNTGEQIIDNFCRSLAPLPGCLFSLTIGKNGDLDHFAHRPYDPDWMMGHDDLAPMFYEAVFRGRYETDDRCGTALILKSPHKLDEYLAYRSVPSVQHTRELALHMIHNEYVLIARHLIQTGMDGDTMLYITNLEQCFQSFGQEFSGDPFPLRELAEQEFV